MPVGSSSSHTEQQQYHVGRLGPCPPISGRLLNTHLAKGPSSRRSYNTSAVTNTFRRDDDHSNRQPVIRYVKVACRNSY